MSEVLKKIKNIRLKGTEGVLFLIVIVLIVILNFATDNFLTSYNLSNLVRQTSIIGIVSIGMTFIIISGGIDLSVGSVAGFSGMLAAILMVKHNWGILPSVLTAMLVSMLFGLLIGVIVHEGKVPPFICTLGALQAIKGCTMLLSGAQMVSGLPKEFKDFANMKLLGFPTLFIAWLIIILIALFATKYTRFGRNIYAVGSNEESARLSGINIRKIRYQSYVLCASTAGIAGILMCARMGSAMPATGSGYETDAIAAAVLGGTSLMGAEGSIIGTVLGAIIMAILRNGGNLLKIDSFVLEITIGCLLIMGVLIDQFRKRRGK